MNNFNNINLDSYWENEASKELEARKEYRETHCIWCEKQYNRYDLELNEGLCPACWKKRELEVEEWIEHKKEIK